MILNVSVYQSGLGIPQIFLYGRSGYESRTKKLPPLSPLLPSAQLQ